MRRAVSALMPGTWIKSEIEARSTALSVPKWRNKALLRVGPIPAISRKPMRLVAQPLHEIEHRIARGQAKLFPARHVKGFPPGVAVRPLRDAHDRNVHDPQRGQTLARSAKLTRAAIDKDEIGPGVLSVLVAGRG